MAQIAIIGEFDIHPEDSAAAGELMRVMMEATVKEAGCEHYSYSKDLSIPNRYQLSELWADDGSLAAHFQVAHMATYRAGMSQLRVLKRTVTRYDIASAKAL